MPIREREVDSLNGMVVFESDGESGAESPPELSVVQKVAARRIKPIHRHKRYFKAKAFVERNFLSKKYTKRTSTILSKHPDIGSVIG